MPTMPNNVRYDSSSSHRALSVGWKMRHARSRRLSTCGSFAVSLAELAGMSFVDGPRGYGNRTLIDDAFNAAGLDRTITLEVSDVGWAAAYIRNGLGIGFLSQFILEGISGAGLATLRIADCDLQWRLCVAALATRVPSAAAIALLSLVGDVRVS